MRTPFHTKVFFTLLALAVASIYACDRDRLDTPPLGVTEENFFQNRNDYQLAVFNVYAKMTDWYWFRAQSFLQRMYYLPGDDITTVDDNFATWELFAGINPNDQNFNEYFWDKTYELIQRANVVIEKTTEADPAKFEDPSFLPHFKGEALFLRALANFKLFNMYGTAPLITTRLTNENTNTPRSEGTQLLDQVILDLQEAANLLPEAWPADDAGRAFKASAQGLLVKALVFRGNYTGNAADYTQAVQVYNAITGRALTPNYTDNFNGLTENNEESIFEFQASNAPGLDNVWLYNDGPWRGVESMATYWGFYTVEPNQAKNNFPGSTWRLTQKVHDAHGSDPRLDFFTEDNRSFTKYGKLGLDVLSRNGGPGSVNNVRILRFADVKLLAAEAMLRTGDKMGAIELINEVRQRAREWAQSAGLGDGTTPADRDGSETRDEVILGWIMEERLIELAGEEQIRWFDLKRWDAAGDIDLSTWTGGDEHFSTDLNANFQFEYPKHLLLPIPAREIERNSAINSNNPGY